MKGTFFSMLVGATAALAVLYVGDFDHISQVVAAATMVIVVLLFIVGETIYEKIDCAVKELKNVPHKEPPASFEG